jgi:hypothetical protein
MERTLLTAMLLCSLAVSPAAAQPAATTQRVAQLIVQLDSDRFELRRRAAEELERLIERGETSSVLAIQFSRALADPQTSFEVRSQLRAWTRRLPAVAEGQVDGSGIEELFRKAVNNSYAARASATEQLAALARQPQTAPLLMNQLRQRLADASLAADDYQRLLELYERARGTWLLSDPATWKLPAVGGEAIEAAVDQLVRPAPASARYGAWRPHAAARRSLLDWLCQDELAPTVQGSLEKRLAGAALDASAQQRLGELLEWTRPALVAEIWRNRRQLSEQHLLVDVPRQSFAAARPSHFSRIDDRTATCVSGQNLTPGEYPVGVAIPHPRDTDWMCHLVNLPTPRRRMRYAYEAQRDEQQRLADLTERTLRAWTAERTYLSGLQILMLRDLHPGAVSRWIGDYFLSIDDRRQEHDVYDIGGINVSHHGRICFVLASMGTREMAPTFLQALRRQRFLPPAAPEAPYDWPWIAALSIAERDPWPEVDAWLASLIDRREPLRAGQAANDEEAKQADPPAELGATAAAMLLKRHEQALDRFGLEPAAAAELHKMGCPAFRFVAASGRQDAINWWAGRQKQSAQREKMP